MSSLQTRMTLSVDDVDAKLRQIDEKIARIEESLNLDVHLEIDSGDFDAFTQQFADLDTGAVEGIAEAFKRASPTAREAATGAERFNKSIANIAKNNPALANIVGQFGALGRTAQALPGPLGAVATGIGSINAATAAAVISVGALAVGLGALGKSAFDFQVASNQLVITTGAAGDELETLAEVVNGIFVEVPVDLNDIATAVGRVSQLTGLAGDDLERLSDQFAKLSILEGSNLDQIVRPLIGTFRNLGVEVEDYSDKLGVLFELSRRYGTSTERLGVTLGAAGSALRVLGLSFDEAAELAAKFNAANLESSEVINSLATASVDINELSDALAALGESASALDVRQVLAGFNVPAEQASKLASSVASGALSFRDFGTLGTEAANSINDTFERTDTVVRRVTLLARELKVALLPIGEVALGIAEDFIEEVTPSIESFANVIIENQDDIVTAFDAIAFSIGAVLEVAADTLEVLLQITNLSTGGLGEQAFDADFSRRITEIIDSASNLGEAEQAVRNFAESLRQFNIGDQLSEPVDIEAILKFGLDEIETRRQARLALDAVKAGFGNEVIEIPFEIRAPSAEELSQFRKAIQRDLSVDLLADELNAINNSGPLREAFVADEEAKTAAKESAEQLAQSFSDGLAGEIERIRSQLDIPFNIDTENGINDVRDAINQVEDTLEAFRRRQEAAKIAASFGLDEIAARIKSGEFDALVDDLIDQEGGTNLRILNELEAGLVEVKEEGANAASEAVASFTTGLAEGLVNLETDPFAEWLSEYEIDPELLAEQAQDFIDGINEGLVNDEALGRYKESGEVSGAEVINGLIAELEDPEGRLYSAAFAAGKRIEAALRDATESESPSKAARRVGEDVNEGLAEGLSDNDKVVDAAMKVAADVEEVLRTGISILLTGEDPELDNSFSRTVANLQAQVRSVREQRAEEERIITQREEALARLEQFGGFALFEEGVDSGEFDDLLRDIILAPNAAVFAAIEDGLQNLEDEIDNVDVPESGIEFDPTIAGYGLSELDLFADDITNAIGPVQLRFTGGFIPLEDGGIAMYRDGGIAELAGGARMTMFGGRLALYNESYRGNEVHVGGPSGEAIVGDYHPFGLSFNRLDRIGLMEKLAPMVHARYPAPGQQTQVVMPDNGPIIAGLQALDQRLQALEGHARSTARSNDMMADDSTRQMALMRREARKTRARRDRTSGLSRS